MSNKLSEIRDNLKNIGDETKKKYDDTKDVNVAKTAISAYIGAIRAAKTQLIYKKMTGTPSKIIFFED